MRRDFVQLLNTLQAHGNMEFGTVFDDVNSFSVYVGPPTDFPMMKLRFKFNCIKIYFHISYKHILFTFTNLVIKYTLVSSNSMLIKPLRSALFDIVFLCI